MNRWRGGGNHTGRVLRLVGVFGLVALLALGAAKAGGRTIYQWTDANGVIHFSDFPPPTGTDFDVRRLPANPKAATPTPPTPAPPGATAPAAEATPVPTGPARVTLVKQSSRRLESSVREFTGTVKNVGGAEADRVVVLITVTEVNQGAECLQAEIDVDPPTLPPGATGQFQAEFDNPCFFGDTSIDLQPEWR